MLYLGLGTAVVCLFALSVCLAVNFCIGLASRDPTETDESDDRPVTDKQLEYIDRLLATRQTEDWMHEQPETIGEAVSLIAELSNRPKRESP